MPIPIGKLLSCPVICVSVRTNLGVLSRKVCAAQRTSHVRIVTYCDTCKSPSSCQGCKISCASLQLSSGALWHFGFGCSQEIAFISDHVAAHIRSGGPGRLGRAGVPELGQPGFRGRTGDREPSPSAHCPDRAGAFFLGFDISASNDGWRCGSRRCGCLWTRYPLAWQRASEEVGHSSQGPGPVQPLCGPLPG